MEIAAQLVQLAELSNIEAKIRTHRDRLETVPKLAKDAELAYEGKCAEYDDVDRKRFAVEKEQKTKERELQAEREHLKKWNVRLDKIRDEREHTALQSEIGGLKRTIRRLENQILECMQEQEDIGKGLTAAQEAKDAAKEHSSSEWAKVQDEVKSLTAEVETLEKSRDAAISVLPDATVKRYQKIAAVRQGAGVALVTGETCSKCHTVLPPQLCLQVWKGIILEGCPSCSRILVHEEMTRSTTAEKVQAEAASA